MEALEALKSAAHEAQNELAAAELALIQATARAEQARTEADRYAAAVAALSGEPPPAAASVPAEAPTSYESAPHAPAANAERAAAREMTQKEFDAERKRRQRQKQKEAMANNPYAHIKCSGCGQLGTMQDSIVTAPSGAPLRMMVCSGCGNQIIQ